MEGSAIRCVVLRNFYFVKAARRIEWCCVVLWVCVLCGFHVVSSFSLKRDFKERTTPFLGNPKPYYFRHIFVRRVYFSQKSQKGESHGPDKDVAKLV